MHEDFMKLVENWYQTRNLAFKINDTEAVRMLDIAYTYLIPKQKIICYTKKYKDYMPIKEVNNLTIKEAFDLELEVYKRVHHYDNFPKLISYDKKQFVLEIENCGRSLDMIGNRTLQINNLDDQIKNICFVLKKENITHLDITPCGKNICTKNNKIYLIDYDMAVVDDKPINLKLKNLYDQQKNKNIYNMLKQIVSIKLRN
jgi:predicted Ser/Thr protein kinase